MIWVEAKCKDSWQTYSFWRYFPIESKNRQANAHFFGKCSLFPRKENDIFRLVNGNHKENIDYHYCSTSREIEEKCGKEGKMYKKKYTRKNNWD